MTCAWESNRPEVLEDYLAGTLGRNEMVEFEAHLVNCTECRAGLATAREAQLLLREAFEPAPPVSAFFWTRLRATLLEEQEHAAASDFWTSVERLAWRLSLGAAALVMLLLGIVIGTQLPPQTSETVGVRAETRDIFPEPAGQAVDSNDVLMELALGRGREGKQ